MKRNFFIFFMLTAILNFLYTQQNIEYLKEKNYVIEETDDKPLQYRFNYIPKFIETPLIDYEDVVVPYNLYIEPQIGKTKTKYDFLFPEVKFDGGIRVLTGTGLLVNYYINNINYQNTFILDADYQRLNINCEDIKPENYILNRYDINYHYINENYLLKNRLVYQNNFLKNEITQIVYSPEINFVLLKNFLFKVNPYLQFNKLTNNEIFFLFNTVELDLLINEKFSSKISINNIDSQTHLFGLNFIIKNIFFATFYFSSAIKYNVKNKNFYFNTKINKKIFNLTVSFELLDSIFYSYIEDYFTKLPDVLYFDKKELTYPIKKEKSLKIGYKMEYLDIDLKYSIESFSKYPTYVSALSSKIEPYFVDDHNTNCVFLTTSFLFKKINLSNKIKYIFYPEEILFTPTLQNELEIKYNLLKKVYFIVNFLYNNKTLTNDREKTYIEEHLITTEKIEYKINDYIAIETETKVPIIGKNYINTNYYYEPYISIGIKSKF
ncbi:MAG: hypothetical protein N2643_02330 [Endomicrobia bacterium]|nr:hypothetical protein [Endomicrobiia bacterium]